MVLAAVTAAASLWWMVPKETQAEEKIYTIVIDPGHGGSNSGANMYGPIEKDMTLNTAFSMYRLLSQFDNVRVYLTRSGDVDVSLDERAAMAAGVNADFLFSLHYNATVDHVSYGSEVLISRVQPYHAMGFQFGTIELEELRNMGVFLRGMKARQGRQGDYYGLLRSASAYGVPAVIIEHCYVDEANDHQRCALPSQQEAFGTADAIAVAKYFGLYSTTLGLDYRGYAKPDVPTSGLIAASVDDGDAPTEVSATQISADAATGEVVIKVRGVDVNDPILYFTYSTDGGATFASPYMQWYQSNPIRNTSAQEFFMTLRLSPGQNASVVIKVRNLFDREAQSAPMQVVW